MKDFKNEIHRFLELLQSNKHFALARFGDGEMIALRKETIASGYGEWMTNGPEPQYEIARSLLSKSFTYRDPNYYVEIVCPCCQGQANFQNMKDVSGQPEENLTFANIFVNSNYKFFVDNFIPEFKKKDIVVIANSKSQVDNLPFPCTFIGVGYNAWVTDLAVIDYIKNMQSTNKIFLFACGPLGKILTQSLWEDNQNNTYLDIGSTLHPWLGSDINIRGYYQAGSFHSNLVCTWGS
jgi:hypothetical protein